MHSVAAKELVKIHDECLEYEQGIESYAEEVGDKRTAAYVNGDKEDFRLIMPVLNGLIADAEAYRDYLMKMFPGGDEDEID